MNIYEFMAENPWLTFFLALIISGMIINIFKAIFCNCYSKDESDDE